MPPQKNDEPSGPSGAGMPPAARPLLHDLSNFLVVIEGNLEYCLALVEGETKESLQDALAGARSALQLTRQLRDLPRG